MRRAALVAIGIACGMGIPGTGHAQLELLLSPELGRLMPRAEYRLTHYPAQDVSRQDTELSLVEHRAGFFTPLVQDSRQELALSGRLRLQEYDTRAVLPDTGGRFPAELWEIRVEPSYRRRLDNGWITGASVLVGSPSDDPFASGDELVIRATAFVRVPHRERNAWIFMLFYANYAEFLDGVPVPGLAYMYNSERVTAVLGLPFTSIQARPSEDLTLELTYGAIRNIRARATYRVLPPLRVWAGFDWDHEFHLRAGRSESDDQLFYYEKRVAAGVRFDLRHAGIEVVGGYAFDRFFFEGEGYSDRHDNRIDVGSGPFVAARLSARF